MAKLHKFTAYVVDYNDDMDTTQELIDYIESRMKYGGSIRVFEEDIKTSSHIEWDDDIDLNFNDCTKENHEKYLIK